jgi:hypothetical protein
MRKTGVFVVLTLFLLAFMLFFAGCKEKQTATNDQQKQTGSTETQADTKTTEQEPDKDISAVDATGDATAVDQQISDVGTLDSDLNDDSMDDASQDLNDIKNW